MEWYRICPEISQQKKTLFYEDCPRANCRNQLELIPRWWKYCVFSPHNLLTIRFIVIQPRLKLISGMEIQRNIEIVRHAIIKILKMKIVDSLYTKNQMICLILQM